MYPHFDSPTHPFTSLIETFLRYDSVIALYSIRILFPLVYFYSKVVVTAISMGYLF